MRLCVFSERLALPGDEGIRNYVVNLIRALTRRHEVLALTTFGADVPEWGVRNVAGNQLLLTVDLARRVCAFRPEIIFYVPTAAATPFSFARARVLGAYGRGAPVALVALQVRHYSSLARAVMSALCPDLVLVQSATTEASLRPLVRRMHSIVPGIDMERFRPADPSTRKAHRNKYGIAPHTRLIVHVGHLKRGRNVQALIPLHRPPQQQVLVVGSTSTEQDKALAAELEHAGLRVIADFVPDIAAIYQMADAYVFPVLAADSAIDVPLSVLEAMACALPVVTTRFGGLPALLPDGPGLRYVDDPAQLAEALADVDPWPCPGNRAMVEPLAWSRVADDLVEIVRGIRPPRAVGARAEPEQKGSR
jgi:glycosyltransferase involved in cell wall biosynthesis